MPSPENNKLETPLPDEAHAALRRGGERLLEQLESLRHAEAARIEIEPLDPQATLALRKRGDDFVSQLAAQRSELEASSPPPPRRRARTRWLGIAAALVGLAGIAWAIGFAFFPSQPDHAMRDVTPAEPAPAQPGFTTDPLASPAIPEPSSALLALIGGTLLLGHRHRPRP